MIVDYAFSNRVDRVLERILKAREEPGKLPGASSGIKALDEAIDGLQPTHLIILAGRPAMGKTALAMNIAYNISQTAPVGFLSLEQPGDELALRVISDASGISLTDLKRGFTTDYQVSALIDIASNIKSRQIFIQDSFDTKLDNIRLEAAKLYDQHKIEALFIDYLQLASANDVRTRESEISQISAGFKHLAKELNIPVIALSQLNREVEKMGDKRPTMGHLRESGSLEQDADIVGLLFREEYYFKQKPVPEKYDIDEYEKWLQEERKVRGRAELIIAKNRHGSTSTVHMAFNSQRMRFSDLEGARNE